MQLIQLNSLLALHTSSMKEMAFKKTRQMVCNFDSIPSDYQLFSSCEADIARADGAVVLRLCFVVL